MSYAYFLFMSTCINNVINLHYRCSDNFFFYIRYVSPSYQKSCITLFSAQHYIRLQDRRTVFFLYIYFNKFKTQPVKIMGKISKVMPLPKSISPGKGSEVLRQKVQIFCLNMVRLNRTYYSLLKFTSKIFKIVSPSQIPANYANSAQFAHTVHEFRKIHTIRLTSYALCFRHLPRQRTLRNSSELRKFHAIHPHSPRILQNSHYSINLLCIMFQAPSPAENPAEFQQITQIPCNSPTQSTNHAKFAPFANITPYVSDA